MDFKDLGLQDFILKTVSEQGYTSMYPIQSKAIPMIMEGRDVLGIAKTGSGKTASYVIPILSSIETYRSIRNRHVNALILAPTRELAIQIQQVFEMFDKYNPQRLKTIAVYGGVSINPQMQSLQDVNILIATPGRLLDLISKNAVNLSSAKTLVLDEADKMLNLGFRDEINQILKLLPKKRQNLLFSATLSSDINEISARFLKNPLVIKIEEKIAIENTINEYAYQVPENNKGPLLRYLIKNKEMDRVLVFTSSIYKANNVAKKLSNNGIAAIAFHGKKSQAARSGALAKFKSGEIKVLVATDLLSRGIDIIDLPFVINYELPRSPKDYIHRIGRTGRAENKGEAISLISPEEMHHFKVILKKRDAWVKMINSDEFDLKGY